jgi:hypothetical protein
VAALPRTKFEATDGNGVATQDQPNWQTGYSALRLAKKQTIFENLRSNKVAILLSASLAFRPAM